MSFVKCVWPDFIEGAHHRHIAEKFNQLASGEITSTDCKYASTSYEIRICKLSCYQRGWWAVTPKLKIIQATHTGELAIRFGRKAKDLD